MSQFVELITYCETHPDDMRAARALIKTLAEALDEAEVLLRRVQARWESLPKGPLESDIDAFLAAGGVSDARCEHGSIACPECDGVDDLAAGGVSDA